MAFLKSILIILGTIFLLWAGSLAGFALISAWPNQAQIDGEYDAIIVLTGGDRRIETGLELLSQQYAEQLFITGVHPDVTRDDINAMHTGSKPLPLCCITLGRLAQTTTENAEETRVWFEENPVQNVILVTSAYHMPRALLEFRRSFPGLRITAHPVLPTDEEIKTQHFWEVVFSEYHKTIFRGIRFLIEELKNRREAGKA